jgi:hypothetical protein
MRYGTTNNAGADQTVLASKSSGATLLVSNTAPLDITNDVIPVGVIGEADYMGVVGTSRGYALFGYTDDQGVGLYARGGTGVYGRSHTGDAIYGRLMRRTASKARVVPITMLPQAFMDSARATIRSA